MSFESHQEELKEKLIHEIIDKADHGYTQSDRLLQMLYGLYMDNRDNAIWTTKICTVIDKNITDQSSLEVARNLRERGLQASRHGMLIHEIPPLWNKNKKPMTQGKRFDTLLCIEDYNRLLNRAR